MSGVLEEDVINHLKRAIGTMPSAVGSYATYGCEAPGKLVRPRLLMCTSACLGHNVADPALLSVAAAVEMGHVASLIHDDIIDGSSLRRGRDALHAKFGTPAAIVTGDALLFSMFHELSSAYPPDVAIRVVRAIADMGMRLCEGELLEEARSRRTRRTAAAARNQDTSSLLTYMRVAHNKTASYFVAMCEIALALAPHDFEADDDLLRTALLFGMVFQVRDDLLRVISGTASAGKPVDIDETNGVVTALDLHRAGFDLFNAVLDYVDHGYVRETSAEPNPCHEGRGLPEAQRVDMLLECFRCELGRRVDALPKGAESTWSPLKDLIWEAL